MDYYYGVRSYGWGYRVLKFTRQADGDFDTDGKAVRHFETMDEAYSFCDQLNAGI